MDAVDSLHRLFVAALPAFVWCGASPAAGPTDGAGGSAATAQMAGMQDEPAQETLRTQPLLRAGAWRELDDDETDAVVAETPVRSEQKRYGARGTKYVEFGGFAGLDGEGLDEPVTAASLTVGRFIADGLAIGARLDLLAFDQDDNVHAAIGLGITFRCHFLERERWTLFVDGGVGMMLSTGGVPTPGGSRFNFTPEMGFGCTFDVNRDWRVVTGVRWHHVSNAKSWRSNPGRDGVVLFAGISVPF